MNTQTALQDNTRSARQQSPFESNMASRMAVAGDDLQLWTAIKTKIEENRFAPASVVYEFMKNCPKSWGKVNLRLDILQSYRSFVEGIDFDSKDPSAITGRLAVLLLLSSHYSAREYLKQKVTTIFLYEALKVKIPKLLEERIANCERYQKEHDGFNDQDFLDAGYQRSVSSGKKAFTHLGINDTIVVGTQKLTGGALLSPEEQEKHRLANLARHNEAMAKRFAAKNNKTPKVKAAKTEEDGKKKGGKKK